MSNACIPKAIEYCRGAIAIVINSRIFWEKMSDSTHIPENNQTNIQNSTTWKIHDLMFLINTLGVQVMLRAVLRV